MPNCYITAHWPHPIRDDIPWDIYLKTTDKEKAAELKPGDRVLFFVTEKIENKTRRTVTKVTEAGKEDVLLTIGGATRFVAEVASNGAIPEPLPKDHPIYLYTGDEGRGSFDAGFRVVCTRHRRTNHCTLAQLKQRLKIKTNPHAWRGLLKVNEAAFAKLVEEIAQ